MDKETKKRIEYAFYNYEELKNSASQELVDLAYKNIAVCYDKPAVKSSVTKTMQDKICAVMDKTSENYRWALVVEKTIEHFSWDCRKQLIFEKYFRKKSETETCLTIGMCRATLFRWIEDILDIAYHWAIELGVITNEKV